MEDFNYTSKKYITTDLIIRSYILKFKTFALEMALVESNLNGSCSYEVGSLILSNDREPILYILLYYVI